jgi:TPR repeat protein
MVLRLYYKHYLSPAKNFRSMNIEEKKYATLVKEKKTKEQYKKLTKVTKKLDKIIKKQGEKIKTYITALQDLCNDGSKRAFSVLIKDLLKNRSLYSINQKIKNNNDLQDFFINLSSRYTINIDVDFLQKTYPELKNNYDALMNKGIDFVYYTLIFFSTSFGDIDALEELSSVSPDTLNLFFKYLLMIKPNYDFLVSTIDKMIVFYIENKKTIINKEELQFQIASFYTNETQSSRNLLRNEKSILTPIDITSMQYLACLGNVKALESLSNINLIAKKYKESAYYAKIGYTLGNMSCGFLWAEATRYNKENYKDLKNIYASLSEQCNSKDDAEYLINEISNYYFLDGLIHKEFDLIDSSFNENFKKIINLSIIHNIQNHERLLQSATLIGFIYFLKTKDNSFCIDTLDWALNAYELDPNAINLLIICQILSDPDWLYKKPKEKNKLFKKYAKLYLNEDLSSDLSQLSDINRMNAFLGLELGSIYLEKENHIKAAHYFKKAIDWGSKTALIPYASLCIYTLDQFNYNEVKTILLKAIDLIFDEDSLQKGYFLLGIVELLHDYYREANHYFELAAKHGSKDATFHLTITQKILENTIIDDHSPLNESPITQNDDDSSSSDTIPIFSDEETEDFTDGHQIDLLNSPNIDLDVESAESLSLSAELSTLDLEPWKKYPPKKLKQDNEDLPQHQIKTKEEKQKKRKIEQLVNELKKSKLNKRKMTKYLSRLLNLVDKKAYITPGEAVRVKFSVDDMVLPMHIQHPSAGNKMESGRLKSIQHFVDKLIS